MSVPIYSIRPFRNWHIVVCQPPGGKEFEVATCSDRDGALRLIDEIKARPAPVQYCKCAFIDPDGSFNPGEACQIHPDVTPQRDKGLAMLERARPCVKESLTRWEQMLLAMEKAPHSNAPHMLPDHYIGTLRDQVEGLTGLLAAIDETLTTVAQLLGASPC